MNAPFRKRSAVNYFAQYRPKGDRLHAKAARAQIDVRERPITLARILFLELSGRELWDALAAKRGRS